MSVVSRALRRQLQHTSSLFSVVTKPPPIGPQSRPYIVQEMTLGKFCANLSMMFQEHNFLDRYMIAKDAGFKAVESGFPYEINPDELCTAKDEAEIQQVLINIYTGDVSKGELGFAAIPGKEKEFRDSLNKTVNIAKILNIPKIHIMSGKPDCSQKKSDEVYEANLNYAVKVLTKENIMGVIEPINKYSVPQYYMNSYDKALKFIKRFDSPHLRLMLDVFHAQQICGNLTNVINEYMPYVGHVQIAQVPLRNEPDTNGEVNYKYVLKHLVEAGYNDWIGLEYMPADNTQTGLKWIKEFGYTLH